MAAKKKELAELTVQADRVRTQLKELETRTDPRQRNRNPAAPPPKTSDGRSPMMFFWISVEPV